MTKRQIKKSWEWVAREMKTPPNWEKSKKEKTYKNVVSLRDLLLVSRAILEKICLGENVAFNTMIFKMSMNFYCKEIKKYQ